MKVALNPNTIQKTDFETQLDVCSKVGYRGFELMYTVIQDYLQKGHSLGDIKRLLLDKNIIPVAVSIESPFWQLEEGEVKSKAVDRATICSEYCNIFGCDIVTVCSGLKDGSLEQAIQDLVDICKIARSYNVKICYEPLGSAKKYKDIKNTLELLSNAECDNCGILLDSFHLYKGRSSLDDIDLIPADKILMVHINDVIDVPIEEMSDFDRVSPGEGILDLDKYVKKLQEKQYSSYISLEIFNKNYWMQDPYVIGEKGKNLVEKLLFMNRQL